jgi:hypothetical protein
MIALGGAQWSLEGKDAMRAQSGSFNRKKAQSASVGFTPSAVEIFTRTDAANFISTAQRNDVV